MRTDASHRILEADVKQLSRVLAAVDFSRPARRAFEYALAISRRHGAELVVVHAVPANQPVNWHARARLDLIERLRRKAEHANVRFAERVQSGDPADIILLHARSLRPDVIVMGTHQRRGIDRLRTGSVAERVTARATAPVLLAPPGAQATTIGPLRHVAVAVDFSAASDRAIEQALALVNDPADRVTLLHVVPDVAAGMPPHYYYRFGLAEYQREMMRDARRRLQLAGAVDQRTRAAIHARVLLGDPATEIAKAVESIGAELVVVGAPRRGVVSRALFGSTAVRLLRLSPVPMLAVPSAGPATAREENARLAVAA
jgi:nucleotide-binding universal stress UspA family protein